MDGAPSETVTQRAASRPAAESASILIAVADPDRAGRIAMACAERNLLATLVFSSEQLGRATRAMRFDLVLLGLVARTRVGSIVTATQRFGDPLVVLLDREELPNPLLAEMGVLAGIDVQAGDSEIASRISALLTLQRRDRSTDPIRWGPLELDVPRRGARWWGEAVDLTPIQFKLLVALARAQGAVMSRDQLAELVWGPVPTDDGERVVAHIRRIRNKLEPDPSHPAFLLTARGEGFRLADQAAVEDRRRDERTAASWRGRERRRSQGSGRRTVGAGSAGRPMRDEEMLQAVRPMATPEVHAEKSRS
ncbi:MAG: winged helix-turn-helix domain-containing protein [Acidimicrobiia bacterium]